MENIDRRFAILDKSSANNNKSLISFAPPAFSIHLIAVMGFLIPFVLFRYTCEPSAFEIHSKSTFLNTNESSVSISDVVV